jgi:hypothetical protein
MKKGQIGGGSYLARVAHDEKFNCCDIRPPKIHFGWVFGDHLEAVWWQILRPKIFETVANKDYKKGDGDLSDRLPKQMREWFLENVKSC